MRREIVGLAASLAALSGASAATAGVYTDDLSKCMVGASSDADKVTLVKWIFSSLSVNPNVQGLAAITREGRDELHRTTGTLYERLVLVDCRAQAVAAVKYEGPAALEASAQVLGEVAARTLMSEPTTAAELGGIAKYLEAEKWEAFGREAGLQGAKD